MTPKAKSGEFFGLYGLCDRFAGILAPLLYGLVGLATHSPQASILSVVVFFAVGMMALWRVDDQAGETIAADEDRAGDDSERNGFREPLQRLTALGDSGPEVSD